MRFGLCARREALELFDAKALRVTSCATGPIACHVGHGAGAPGFEYRLAEELGLCASAEEVPIRWRELYHQAIDH